MSLFGFHEKYLKHMDDNAYRRGLYVQNGVIFSSNDYLALANSDELKLAAKTAIDLNIAIGSGGSRLLSGNHPQHEALEHDAADFFHAQSILFFANGYAANVAAISTLPQTGDIIFYDALIHASSHDGMRLARCPAQSFKHNDPADLEHHIRQWQSDNADHQNHRIWILYETLYSMDGDIAPIAEYNALAKKYDAIMIIDEAHATGVFGPDGRGLAAHLDGQDNSIILRTCGKAMGVEGALLSMPTIAKEFLINRGRHFIFSTAPSPFVAYLVRASLGLLRNQPDRRDRLTHLCKYAEQKLSCCGAIANGTPIIPILIGDAGRTMKIAAALQKDGFDVRGIRPPTVADGTSRLRICISLNIGETDIDNVSTALKKLM